MKPKRYIITRTVTAGRGITCEIELSALDASDAERQAANLFAHEKNVSAVYRVQVQ